MLFGIRDNQHMKIEVLGWFNKGNAGDECFKAAHHYIFRKHKLTFITPPAKCTNPDMVILGGGAVVSPFYFNSLAQIECPKYMLGVSISYMSEMDMIPKNTFKHIYLRDAFDVEPLRQKIDCPVDAIPDLAFVYRPTGQDIRGRYKNGSQRRPLGVMLTDYVSPAIDRPYDQFGLRSHSFVLNMAAELDKLQRQGWEVYLIPLSTGGYGNDIRINLELAAHMKEQPIVIYDTLSPQDCVDLVAQMDMTICMKFHAHIFSMLAGVPFVSMGFTRKVDLFLEAHDLKCFTGAKFINNEFDTSNFGSVMDEALSQRKHLASKFIDVSEGYSRRIREITATIRRDWLGESS